MSAAAVPPLTPDALRALIAEEGNEHRWTYRGIECEVKRFENTGHWCGYVRIPDGHPWRHFPRSYDDLPVEVHGGLTYRRDREEDGYWIGFDCGHAGDLTPSYLLQEDLPATPMPGDVYRTRAYTEAECQELADQILAFADQVKVFAVGMQAQAEFRPGEAMTIRTENGSVTIDPENAEHLAVVIDAWLMTLKRNR